ncbi:MULTISPECIES: hypothetical protein [unclassified Paenibacillus]|uniref:hypothetical protein n=1 Tax=unclassified Paenibacillus TaxID=185978 RepID=UPI0007FEA5E0|nr:MULTISPECIES: hypothetical protein [unclassified Paenibacillus]OAX46303.1 hypothetical protein gpAD87_27775 [Paenibacillus sp. AD87]SEL75526.1 hypothetical protein SAMN05518856_11790 [Paenibacillus sp. OK003]
MALPSGLPKTGGVGAWGTILLSDGGVCAPRLPGYDSRHSFTWLNHSPARSLCGV